MRPAAAAALVAATLALALPGRADATWSIVAVDPGTGAMGVATASCVANDLRQIAVVQPRVAPFGSRPGRPARGALVVQAAFEPANRDRAAALLRRGLAPDEILRRLTDPAADPRAAERQYAVVGGGGRAATFTGAATGAWAGARTARGLAVAGNLLAGPAVVDLALAAYRARSGRPLGTRLMAALLAGARAGGDARCGAVRATSAALIVQGPATFTFASAVTAGARPRNAVLALAEKVRRSRGR